MKLEAVGVTKRYGHQSALDGVDFETGSDARVIALLGPSGGGKSTLLRVLGCLLTPDEGTIHLDGRKLPNDEAETLIERRQNGFVFQGYNLFPHLSALENITLPLREVHQMSAGDAHARAVELLARLGLSGHEHKRPAELSGGQQQRAAIARALAPKPRLLLLDEPTSALDPVMTGEVLDVIGELAGEGQHIVLSTHEIAFAKQVSDTVVFLSNGKALETTPTQRFFEEPTSEAARHYLQGLSKYR